MDTPAALTPTNADLPECTPMSVPQDVPPAGMGCSANPWAGNATSSVAKHSFGPTITLTCENGTGYVLQDDDRIVMIYQSNERDISIGRGHDVGRFYWTSGGSFLLLQEGTAGPR